MQHIHLIVKGRVQGVGFRFSAKQIAMENNVNGWVRNKTDGTVEIEAEGKDENVEQFIDRIKKGPTPYAKVKDVEIREFPDIQGYKNFEVTT